MLRYAYTACLAFFPLGDSPASEFTSHTKIEQTECSETSAHTIQMPEITQKKTIKRSEHGGSFKSITACHV